MLVEKEKNIMSITQMWTLLCCGLNENGPHTFTRSSIIGKCGFVGQVWLCLRKCFTGSGLWSF